MPVSRVAERFPQAIFSPSLGSDRRTGDSLASLRSCSAGAVDSGADQAQPGEHPPTSLEVPTRRWRLEAFGFLLQVAQVVVHGGDERIGSAGPENAQSYAVTGRVRTSGEQHGKGAQPAPADGRAVDPQHGDISALIARAAPRAKTSMAP